MSAAERVSETAVNSRLGNLQENAKVSEVESRFLFMYTSGGFLANMVTV